MINAAAFMADSSPRALLLTLTLLVWAPTAESQQPKSSSPLLEPLWLVAPAGRHAEIELGTTLADLTTRFGRENVQAGQIELGEGEFSPGTVLFARDPTRRLEIVWKAGETGGPATIFVRGAKSRWTVPRVYELVVSYER